MCYIATYHARAPLPPRALPVAFGLFKRDAMLFKSLALAQAAVAFARHFTFSVDGADWLALALMAAGFGLSSAATLALGVDRTYFGWELCAVKGEHVVRWPYGTVPHPMILGSVTAWLGFHKLAAFRADLPWFVPLHVALYTVHAVQEHLAIHSTGKLAAQEAAQGGEGAAPPAPAPEDADWVHVPRSASGSAGSDGNGTVQPEKSERSASRRCSSSSSSSNKNNNNN